MAGVYIKGMEMPENCWLCGFKDSDNFCTAVFAVDNTVETVIGMWEETKRPDWCPLVEVPDHGDLIDESEKVDVQYYEDKFGGWSIKTKAVGEILAEVCEVPLKVVIQADKEGI